MMSVRVGEDRFGDWGTIAWTVGVAAASIGFIALGAYRLVNVYDEGVSAYGAARVAAGDVPYRDFWTIYAPADFYLIAALFKLFGLQLIVVRHAWVLLEAAVALLVFAIACRLGTRRWALLSWALLVVWTRQVPFFGSPVIPALVCGLGAILITIASRVDDRRAALIAGLLVGLCTLFRQDFGLYTFIAIAATLAFAHDRARATLRWFVAATAITLTPAVIALFAVVPTTRLVEQFITFPFETYSQTRALAWPALPRNPLVLVSHDATRVSLVAFVKDQARSWQFYSSTIVLGVGAIWSLIARSRGTFLVAAFGLLLLNHARTRSDVYHLYPVFVCALIVAASLISAAAGVGAGAAMRRVKWAFDALAAFAAIAVASAVALTLRSEWAAESRQRPFDTDRTSGLFLLDQSHAYEDAIAYVQHHAAPDPNESIFVGTTRHDQLIVNDVLFYFLSARRSATRYHDMHPGVVTTAPVQQEMVRDLERQHVQCVVRWEPTATIAATPMSMPNGAHILDEYIAEHFTPGPRFDAYQVWERKGSHDAQ
jgi:hypothetical protein